MKMVKRELAGKLESTGTTAAEALKAQYQVVIKAEAATFKERVRFGAMLIQWEQYLGKSLGGRGSDGDGLKGWLEKNCPEISYSAARGYKSIAEKAIKMLGGGQMAAAALLGDDTVRQPDGETVDVESEYVSKAEDLFEKADSRRKLELMWFEFTKNGGEKRKGLAKSKVEAAAATADEATISPADSALTTWDEVFAPVIQKRGVFYASARDLPVNAAENFLAELEALIKVLKQRLAE